MFKIANTSMAGFSAFNLFRPDITIRILDTIKEPPNPNFPNLEFSSNPFPNATEYCFRFDDVTNEKDPECITDEQAKMLYNILTHAAENRLSVLSHCVMGKCRSGAITDAGAIIAKSMDIPVLRHDNRAIPNSAVKSKILRHLYL